MIIIITSVAAFLDSTECERYVIAKEDVIEEAVGFPEEVPLLSRWLRLDGYVCHKLMLGFSACFKNHRVFTRSWLYDTLVRSFSTTSLPPHDARQRRQRQQLRSDLAGWFGVQVQSFIKRP